MKKGISISIIVVMLAAMLHLTMATHYCGGKLAAVKISLTGKKATCGMAQSDSKGNSQVSIGSKCCDDQILYLSLNNNYYPEYFQISGTSPNKQVIYIEHNLLSETNVLNTTFFNDDFPPGKNVFSRLTQSDICVFRI